MATANKSPWHDGLRPALQIVRESYAGRHFLASIALTLALPAITLMLLKQRRTGASSEKESAFIYTMR